MESLTKSHRPNANVDTQFVAVNVVHWEYSVKRGRASCGVVEMFMQISIYCELLSAKNVSPRFGPPLVQLSIQIWEHSSKLGRRCFDKPSMVGLAFGNNSSDTQESSEREKGRCVAKQLIIKTTPVW